MDKLFENKWAIRVISLIFAISLFLYVSIENNPRANPNSPIIPSATTEIQVIEDFPLDVRIDAEQFVVSGVPEFVKVSLEGKTSVLTPVFRQRNFKVFADLKGLPEGEHTVPIEYEGIPDDLKIFIEPKSIDVTIERRATQEFTVDIDLINRDQLPLGYEISDVAVKPETVTIISSQGVIDQIATVKVYVDVKDLKESIQSREVPVSAYDIQGNDLNVRIEPHSVAISVQVERPSKKVPLVINTMGQLQEGLEIVNMESAPEIEVFGKRELLNQLEEIATKSLDLSKVDKSGDYEVELDFPEGIIANNDTETVKIDLEQTEILEDIAVKVEGDTDGNFRFTSPSGGKMAVKAIGSDKAIARLKKADITLSIDVKDLAVGSHQVEVDVTGPDGVTLEPEFTKVTVEILDAD